VVVFLHHPLVSLSTVVYYAKLKPCSFLHMWDTYVTLASFSGLSAWSEASVTAAEYK